MNLCGARAWKNTASTAIRKNWIDSGRTYQKR